MRCGIRRWATTCVHSPRPCSDEQAPDPRAHGPSEASGQVEPTAKTARCNQSRSRPSVLRGRGRSDFDASSMKFTVNATDGAARAGTLELAHGSVETPVFMPV